MCWVKGREWRLVKSLPTQKQDWSSSKRSFEGLPGPWTPFLQEVIVRPLHPDLFCFENASEEILITATCWHHGLELASRSNYKKYLIQNDSILGVLLKWRNRRGQFCERNQARKERRAKEYLGSTIGLAFFMCFKYIKWFPFYSGKKAEDHKGQVITMKKISLREEVSSELCLPLALTYHCTGITLIRVNLLEKSIPCDTPCNLSHHASYKYSYS